MVEILLAAALRSFLADLADTFSAMPSDDNLLRKPVVVDGYLPQKRETDVDFSPQIIVRVMGSTAEREVTEVTVDLILCCHSKSNDGYAYLLTMAERIRTALLRMPMQTLDKRYVLQFTLECRLPDDQPWPNWQMSMSTRWLIKTPQFEDQF